MKPRAFLKIFLTGLLILCSRFVFAQYECLNYPNNIRFTYPDIKKRYTSIEEGLKEPDKVIYLDLRSHALRSFPEEILKFKNLKYLDFSALDMAETDSTFKADPIGSNYDGVLYRPNIFRDVPLSLGKLKKLNYIDFSDTLVSKETIRRLMLLLPMCTIEYDEDSEN